MSTGESILNFAKKIELTVSIDALEIHFNASINNDELIFFSFFVLLVFDPFIKVFQASIPCELISGLHPFFSVVNNPTVFSYIPDE